MILMEPPSALRLFLVMQGSIVPQIVSKIISVAVLSGLVLLLDRHVVSLPRIPIAAMGVFGIALSLFLGFRNNAAYDRWWEARRLWGALIGDVRNLARQLALFNIKTSDRDYILSNVVAFAHLHKAFLRKQDAQDDLSEWMDSAMANKLCQTRNPADAALRSITHRLADLAQAGDLSGYGQMTISQTMSALANAQAGCERIAMTPLPFVYSLLIRRTTYLYCFLLPFALIGATSWFTPVFAAIVAYVFFGLQAVTNELEHPFSNVQNGLPLDAMCRVIEISAAEASGRVPPEPLTPKNHVLT
ncbi:bestrophin family protein [Roseibium sp. SCP14]|uniref:bestrophin family protein n=1 Tax=Roseibium sp. SCP14 TaxID=3141375 RepID=UPI00333BA0BD